MKDLDFRYYSKLVHKWWLDVEIAQENRKQYYSYIAKEDYDLMHEDLKKIREHSSEVFSILCEQVRCHRDYEITKDVYLISNFSSSKYEDIVDYCSMFSINTIYYCDSSSAALEDLTYLWEHQWSILDVVNVKQSGKYSDYTLKGFKLVKNEEEKKNV